MAKFNVKSPWNKKYEILISKTSREKVIASKEENSITGTQHSRRPSEGYLFRLACYSSALIVPIAIAASLPYMMSRLRDADFFEGVTIGGSLTLSQAKAVDFISSAVLVPLIMAVLNYVWFSNSRASIGDCVDGKSNVASLYALCEASSTTSGSYDPYKLWALCCSGGVRFKAVALTVIFAAMARSTLTNFIAYESFSDLVESPPEAIRLLTGVLFTSRGSYVRDGTEVWQYSNVTYRQRILLEQGLAKLQDSIAYENSTQTLQNNTYVLPNSTKFSLDGIHGSVARLQKVPATRGFVECRPQFIDTFEVSRIDDSLFELGGYDVSNSSDRWSFTSRIPDAFADVREVYWSNETYDFDYWTSAITALDQSNLTLFLGGMGGPFLRQGLSHWSDVPQQPVFSPFGELSPKRYNVSTNSTGCGTSNCSLPIYSFTYACNFRSQDGYVDLLRNLTSGEWENVNGLWTSAIVPRPLTIGTFIYLTNNFQDEWNVPTISFREAVRVGSDRCGIDPYANSSCVRDGRLLDSDQGNRAHAWLRIDMEVSRIIAELAALNSTRPAPGSTVSLHSLSRVQRYRMTYIPVLLFVGLAGVFVAAVTVSTITIRASKSRTAQEFRVIDNLRLLVDFAVNMQPEKLDRAQTWSNDELENWAKDFLVRYTVQYSDDEMGDHPSIVLEAVEKDVGRPEHEDDPVSDVQRTN